MSLFDILQTGYQSEIGANDLINQIGQTVKMVGQYICEKTVVTKNDQKMWFGNFLDTEVVYINVQSALKDYSDPVQISS